jgi:hypothetical protein
MIENLSRRSMIQSVFGGVGAVGLSSLLGSPLEAAQPLGRYAGTRTPGKANTSSVSFFPAGHRVDMFDKKPLVSIIRASGQGLPIAPDRGV